MHKTIQTPQKAIPWIKSIGLILKRHEPEAATFATELVKLMIEKKIKILFAEESQSLAKRLAQRFHAKRFIQVTPKKSLMNRCDLIVVLGGDGTFLSIARLIQKKIIPLMGINMGRLGFLTEIHRTEAIPILTSLIAGGAACLKVRSLLEVTVSRQDQVIFQGPVVNDAVISKGAIARIIGMQIWINHQWVHNLLADGMIVSTPTGSTAYALAAGGPIIEPSVPAILLAPICPHSVTLRPLIIPQESTISICLNDQPGHVFLSLDGQDQINLKEGDCVRIRCYPNKKLHFIASPSKDYFSLLREKLKFGARD